MRLARRIEQQAEQSDWLGADGVSMFERLARAVRQTTALEIKIEADSQMSEQQRAAELARRTSAAAGRTCVDTQKDQVKRLGEAAIETDAEGPAEGRDTEGRIDRRDADPREAENLLRHLRERLEDPDVEAAFGQRSVGEIIFGICQDLGIAPKAGLWSDTLVETAIDAAAAALHDGPGDSDGDDPAEAGTSPCSAGSRAPAREAIRPDARRPTCTVISQPSSPGLTRGPPSAA